jgi:hypothetical protein
MVLEKKLKMKKFTDIQSMGNQKAHSSFELR